MKAKEILVKAIFIIIATLMTGCIVKTDTLPTEVLTLTSKTSPIAEAPTPTPTPLATRTATIEPSKTPEPTATLSPMMSKEEVAKLGLPEYMVGSILKTIDGNKFRVDQKGVVLASYDSGKLVLDKYYPAFLPRPDLSKMSDAEINTWIKTLPSMTRPDVDYDKYLAEWNGYRNKFKEWVIANPPANMFDEKTRVGGGHSNILDCNDFDLEVKNPVPILGLLRSNDGFITVFPVKTIDGFEPLFGFLDDKSQSGKGGVGVEQLKYDAKNKVTYYRLNIDFTGKGNTASVGLINGEKISLAIQARNPKNYYTDLLKMWIRTGKYDIQNLEGFMAVLRIFQ